jgi:lysophospholipase L1-like esterase
VRYLALGDSYTIGTGASDDSHSWPSIIASRLGAELTNPAVNGFTTLDLIRDELPWLQRVQPDLVSILIGVNDLVQGRRVAAVSIPTWSYVPAANDFGGKDHVERMTLIFNRVVENEARAHKFTWIDIAEASTSGVGTSGWIASDGLHPGDKQYAAWAEVIWSAVNAWAR